MSFPFNSKWYRPGFWRNFSQMGPLGKEKNTLSSPRKLSSTKNYFNYKQPIMWTSHREQDCSGVKKKPRGRPPYQANKQLVSKADRTAFPEIHPELPQLRDISDLCGNCRWDWSKYVIWSVATFHEVLFRHLTGKGTLKAGVTADLDPSSQIWIPLSNFSFKRRFYHIW